MKKTIRIPLANKVDSRGPSPNTDGRTVNAYFDTKGDKTWVVKRPGFSPLVLSPIIAAGTAQGLYTFNSNVYAAVGGALYQITVSGTGIATNNPTNRILNKFLVNSITLG
jgi:hypothetical protein